MTRTLTAILVLVLGGGAAAQEVTPPVPPNAPTSPAGGPPGAGMAPKPRYEDRVHPFELRPGDRVRIWDHAGELRKEKATVVGIDHTGIAATIDGRARLVRFDDTLKMQTRRGSGRARLGALIGFGIGAALYALRDDTTNDPWRDFGALTGTFTVLGALAGNFALAPSWKPVDLAAVPTGPQSEELRPQSFRIEPAAPPGVRVSLRF